MSIGGVVWRQHAAVMKSRIVIGKETVDFDLQVNNGKSREEDEKISWVGTRRVVHRGDATV